MPVGLISSSAVAAHYGPPQPAAEQASGAAAGGVRTVADHVAASDDSEPIRSVSATQGTLVDTYL
jgi:hypothetical protein